ncbi:hypothetical protein Bca52824_077130 [Brassica carinata]|uniref:Uncharacterized protein n=1 Tax=Brassica carinata TaxID=52824 RepID=A0A8X7TY96_BRACI|nr:hypothetical protein Bca52824_077130 [Brassica carinata]
MMKRLAGLRGVSHPPEKPSIGEELQHLVSVLYGSQHLYRARDKEFQRVFVDTAGNSYSYVSSLAHPHGSSKQDTTRIRYRKNRFN